MKVKQSKTFKEPIKRFHTIKNSISLVDIEILSYRPKNLNALYNRINTKMKDIIQRKQPKPV